MNTIGEKINMDEFKRGRRMSCQVLLKQLRMNVIKFMSWGSHAYTYIGKHPDECYGFRMKVNGHHHKGHIYIALNGTDLYDVYFTTTHGKIVDIKEDLFFDQLNEVIDRRIEKIGEYKF
jgi:hypothetical protein